MSTATAPQANGGWGQTAENHFAGQEQNFDFDSEGVDTSKVGNETRFDVDKPGKYHFTVSAQEKFAIVDEKSGEQVSPHVSLQLTVVHSVEGQSPEGSSLFVNLWVAGKGGAPREDWQTANTLNILTGFGLVVEKDGKLIDPENGTTKLNYRTWAKRLHGVQCIGDVKLSKPDTARLNPKTGQPYPSRAELPFGRGIYQVDDPKVKDVPKSAAALAVIGKANAAPGGNATGNATPAGNAAQPSNNAAPKRETVAQQPQQTAPQQQPAAAPAPDDEFDI